MREIPMSLTLPVAKTDAVPVTPTTEFELPVKARELVTRILSALLAPYRAQVAGARKAQKEAKDAAEARLQKTKALVESSRQRLARLTTDAETYLKRHNVFVQPTPALEERVVERGPADDDFAAHMREHGIQLDDEGTGATAVLKVAAAPTVPQPTTGGKTNVTERDCAFALEFMEREFQALRRKQLPYWPENNWARGAIIGTTLFLYGAGLLWFVVVMISRMQWQNAAGKAYQSLLDARKTLSVQLMALETQAEQNYRSELAKADADLQRESERIDREFQPIAQALQQGVAELAEQSASAGADWDWPVWATWAPDPSPEFAARLGQLEIAAPDLGFSKIDFSFVVPALVPFGDGRCLLFNAQGPAKDKAAAALLGVMVRVLANTPPGKARFTFIDPVGLGQNVADFMHLGDLNKDLISGKAWSEPQHIEQQLTLLTEHIETVIQTCLRNEFATIRDYNRERHEVAQPFRFLVVNDFPVNFTDSAARRLVSIVKNGPRCGVYTFIVYDAGKKLPYGFELADLENAAVKIAYRGDSGKFVWQDKHFDEFLLTLDDAPPKELTQAIVKKSGEVAIPAMKFDVPFERILAAAELEKEVWWKASSAEKLTVPLGPAGARALQHLTLGGEQEAHALLVGRTGSGKTNLMHVIITAIALKYSPEEVQLYLIDFKGGVGFKRYAEYHLPQAKVIAIESEREFGMSVLQGLDAELKRRSEAFRSAGVDSLAGYRANMASENLMPRIFLIVDEFQEFFTENDDLGQQAKTIFERLARQGRSYGIHFLLATQSLSGSAQLPASIMGQIKVRIALPCSEADSRLILADDNKAARALSQAGEAIYNPMGGLIEGNNRFQVARFSDADLSKYLSAVAESKRNGRSPLIFEGNELAHLKECTRLNEALQAQDWPAGNKGVDILLGEPIAILPPVAAALRRQSGRNLMVLSREEGEGVGICIAAAVSILAQQAPQKTRIYIADFTTADSEWAGCAREVADNFPGQITILSRQRDVPVTLAAIAKEVQARGDSAPPAENVFLILQGMHRIKPLREDMEDENGNNAVELLKLILRDGPEVGVHVIAWADTWGNATRGLDRRGMGEFGLRVAAVMESGDSMNFLDSLAASKISKPHRALFYDEDRPGQLVAFRSYALPPTAWLHEVGRTLKSRRAASAS